MHEAALAGIGQAFDSFFTPTIRLGVDRRPVDAGRQFIEMTRQLQHIAGTASDRPDREIGIDRRSPDDDASPCVRGTYIGDQIKHLLVDCNVDQQKIDVVGFESGPGGLSDVVHATRCPLAVNCSEIVWAAASSAVATSTKTCPTGVASGCPANGHAPSWTASLTCMD